MLPAQELDPGAFWPLPKGLNIVTAVGGVNWGDVTFDPALPVLEAERDDHVDGRSRLRDPSASRDDRPTSAWRCQSSVATSKASTWANTPRSTEFGLGDPRLRVAVNLYGAPSMTPREFASYRQRLIVGVSLVAVPPLGQYDSTKIINIGTNRWSFKPEIGLSHTYNGRWVVEFMVGAWFFTDNTNFVGGRTREQDPIVATQVHFTRRFTPSMWLAADANFYTGGRTTVDGNANVDLQKNSRIGATFSRGLGGGHAIRASVSRGAYTTIGADFTSIAVGYNYAWVN